MCCNTSSGATQQMEWLEASELGSHSRDQVDLGVARSISVASCQRATAELAGWAGGSFKAASSTKNIWTSASREFSTSNKKLQSWETQLAISLAFSLASGPDVGSSSLPRRNRKGLGGGPTFWVIQSTEFSTPDCRPSSDNLHGSW